MQINISGHHLDITDALRDYVDEKFAKLERHFDQITSIQVILSPEPKSHKAESTIHISGADVFATAHAAAIHAATDALTNTPARQKHNNKAEPTDSQHRT